MGVQEEIGFAEGAFGWGIVGSLYAVDVRVG
jgi:hypothetical protein